MHSHSQISFNERTEVFEPTFASVFGNPKAGYRDKRLIARTKADPKFPQTVIGSEYAEELGLELGERFDLHVETWMDRKITTRARRADISILLHDSLDAEASFLLVAPVAVIHEGPAFRPIFGQCGFFEFFDCMWVTDPLSGLRRLRIAPNHKFLLNVKNRVEGWECRCPLY